MVVPVVAADTYEWYGVSDLFVSASDIESLPRTVLEAMAFDLPVAATRVLGLPDLLDDGRTGHFCEPADISAMAELLDRHLSMIPAQRQAMARAAARRVREHHDSHADAAQHAELFPQLVAGAPSPAGVAGALLLDDRDDEDMSRELWPYDSMIGGVVDNRVDTMDQTPDKYFAVARSARRNIRLALAHAGRLSPSSILDSACGYGRVLRVLRHDYPDAEITACDIDRDGVDFCARAFFEMCVAPGVMGATPGHPFLRRFLAKIPRDIEGPEAFSILGPQMATSVLIEDGLRGYSEAPITVGGVTILPKDVFYPYFYREPFDRTSLGPETLAVHHWAKRW